MKIYVVYASYGAYSDRTEWPVAAYRDEALAKSHMMEAEKWAERFDRENPSEWGSVGNPWDEEYRHGYYDNTSYYVTDVELRDELPQVGDAA